MKVGTVIGPPTFSEGVIVRVVVGPGDTIVPERWSAKDGAWVPGGDPAVPAFGRRLPDEEVAALP